MFICLCNAVRDKEINQAIAQGASTVSEVYRQCGCQPQCGKCVDYVRRQLDAHCVPA